jgi:tetratricopeptide (TPR) repeat protein
VIESERNGKIITFYSYKGGTGRSMVLANVAWILADNGKKVLIMDWDLEAPGLHRYFYPFLEDKDLVSSPGVIDFLIDYSSEVMTPPVEGEPEDWYKAKADISKYAVAINYKFSDNGCLDFVPAGLQGMEYSKRFATFDWEDFYKYLGGGVFIEATKEIMRAKYDYILIDSRTGISDTAGICTIQMPDCLVVCFTLNNQNIEGAANVAKSVYEQRCNSKDSDSFRIYPVPMRVSFAEKEKLDSRRDYAWKTFDSFLKHIPNIFRREYRRGVEIPEITFFSYYEVIAAFLEKPNDPNSLLSAVLRLTKYLTDSEDISVSQPKNLSEILNAFEATPLNGNDPEKSYNWETLIEKWVRLADDHFNMLPNKQQQESKMLWTRLVTVSDTNEKKRNTRFSELNVHPTLIEFYMNAGLLMLDGKLGDPKTIVEISFADLIYNWDRLRGWIEDDREFLEWRLRLDLAILTWREDKQNNEFLLRGERLKSAKNWMAKRERDLNEDEKKYIRDSEKLANKQRRNKIIISSLVIGIIIVLSLFFLFARQEKEKQSNKVKAQEYKKLADESSSKGEFNSAIKTLSEAITLDQDFSEAYNDRGKAYLKLKNYDDSIKDFNQYLRFNPEDALAYYDLAEAFYANGNYREAITQLNEVVRLNPSYAKAYQTRGKVYEAIREFGQALEDFTTAIKFDDTYAEAHYNRAILYSETGNLDSALQDFTKAISLKPSYAEAYNGRGLVLLNKGNLDQAVKDFTSAINYKSDYAEAFYNRGTIYKDKWHAMVGALSDFYKAITYSPDNPLYYKSLGDVLYTSDSKETALNNYTEAINRKPEYVEAYLGRAQCYRDRGDFQKAADD